jgi:hypothetical protein
MEKVTMPLMTKNDLNYDYKWTVTEEDNPKLIRDDGRHLNRNEGYEMLLYLNDLTSIEGGDLPIQSRKIVEWMLKAHYQSTAPGSQTVTHWVVTNWSRLVTLYPFE